MDRNWVVAGFVTFLFFWAGNAVAHLDDPRIQRFLAENQAVLAHKFPQGDSCDTVYKLTHPKGFWVLKVLHKRRALEKRRAIVRATEWAGQQGLGPRLVWHDDSYGYMVTTFASGRHMRPQDIQNKDLLKRVTLLIKRAHQLPPANLTGLNTYPLKARVLRRWSETDVFVPQEKKRFWARLRHWPVQVQSDENYQTPCHSDMKLGNILLTDNRPALIDWGEVSYASIYDDLGSFAYHFKLSRAQEFTVLTTYLGRLPTYREMVYLKVHRRFAALNQAFWKMRIFCLRHKADPAKIKKCLDFFKVFL